MPTRKNFIGRRQKRQDEAKLRESERAKRSNAEQLELIKTRPGESKREVERLNAS